MPKRDVHKYHLKRGHTIIRSGITNDLDRREKKHQQEYGPDVHITKVGRVTTRNATRAWEKEERKGTP
jgi:predicted GIY-YIG superfamily endonuclease